MTLPPTSPEVSAKTPEARRTTRTPYRAAVHVSGPFGIEELGDARDISLGGMFIETDAPLAFGTPVVVRLQLPSSSTPTKLSAIVRWVHATGIGVQFTNLGARETHDLLELARPASTPL